jgi:hypothetical protein
VQPEQVMIVTAAGYGKYRRDRYRLHLDVLCAIHQVADIHLVPLRTAGTGWTPKAPPPMSTRRPSSSSSPPATSGHFASDLAYTQHRDWFAHQVRQINSGIHGRMEVFHRDQTD